MNLTKLCVPLARSPSGWQRHVVLLRGGWKKAVLPPFSQEGKITNGRRVVLDFLSMGDRCCQQRAQTQALPVSHESSFYPSALLCPILYKLKPLA